MNRDSQSVLLLAVKLPPAIFCMYFDCFDPSSSLIRIFALEFIIVHLFTNPEQNQEGNKGGGGNKETSKSTR